ncbi:MAG: DUF4278 domain-containing protein [Cyanobacteria bacterium J06627_8]
MRLSYCGLPFDIEPPSLDKAETQFNQQNLKRHQNFAYPRHVPIVHSTRDLQKRGIAYHTQAGGRLQPKIPVASSGDSMQASSLNLSSTQRYKQQLMRDLAKRHKANIQQRLQHRLSVARANGNQSLIDQLEREMHQMA